MVRDHFKAKVASSQSLSDAKSVAGISSTLMKEYRIDDEQVYCDNF